MTNRLLLQATILFGACAAAACTSSSTTTDAIVGGDHPDATEGSDSGGSSGDGGGGGGQDAGTMNMDGGTGDHRDAAAGRDGGDRADTGGDHPDASAGGQDAGGGGRHIQTVFIIPMENKNWADVNGSSSATYATSLLAMGAHSEDYHGNSHPSEPNYIWMIAGDNLSITNDNDPPHQVGGGGNHSTSTDNFGSQLNAAGVSWKSYQENITGTVCPLTSAEPASGTQIGHGYRPKHNPFIFFDALTGGFDPMNADCIAHNRPLTELQADLANNTVARFNFITPNLCNDMHDTCAPQNDDVKQGDDFLSATVPMIMGSQAYQNGGLIIILWDESTISTSCVSLTPDCPVGMIMLSPFAKTNYSSMTHYDHSSLLRTLEDIYGISTHIRAAASATTMSEFFTAFP